MDFAVQLKEYGNYSNNVGIYIIIKASVIKCPSISNMEDTAVTVHLEEREQHITEDRSEEDISGCRWHTPTSSNISRRVPTSLSP